MIAVYAFSVGAAFSSLGVAITTWRRAAAGRPTSLIVVWAIDQRGIARARGRLGGESSWAGLAVGMGSPFLGVNLLATAMIYPSARPRKPWLPGLCCGALCTALPPAWLLQTGLDEG